MLELLNNFTNKHKHGGLIIERMEVDFVFSRLCDKINLRIMDIGSHHGEFLDIFERHNDNHTYDVICVEPLIDNLLVLRKKIRNYRRVNTTLCDVAISDKTENKVFYKGSSSTLFTCHQEWTNIFPDEFKDREELSIQCLTISDLMAKFQIDTTLPFDFIKIDTEGHDYNVIKSLMEARVKPFAIMFEIDFDTLQTDLSVDLLKNNGYKEFYIFCRTGIPTMYIGEYSGKEQLTHLAKQDKFQTGNIVTFLSANLS